MQRYSRTLGCSHLGAVQLIAALPLKEIISGWASAVIPVYVVCDVQHFRLSIIYEYIGKIHFETKRRLRFIISQSLLSARALPAPHKATATEQPDREIHGASRV